VVVGHRLGTAARCDLVAWLDRGRLRRVGPHAELWTDRGYRTGPAAREPAKRKKFINASTPGPWSTTMNVRAGTGGGCSRGPAAGVPRCSPHLYAEVGRFRKPAVLRLGDCGSSTVGRTPSSVGGRSW
jgi:hypothetical protein